MWVVVILSTLNLFRTPILTSFSTDPRLIEVIGTVWVFMNFYIAFDIL